MKVKDLIEILETYDENAEVIIGMRQRYGTDFAKSIEYDIAERKIRAFYGADFKAVVITEGSQIGAVVYNDDDDDDDWYDDEE
jgi:hypothetical protein